MDFKKSISIIIPNYNGKHLLQEYLPHNYGIFNAAGMEYEVIIIDDASTDGSVEFVRSVFPEAKLIINPESKGLSHSYNRGIAAAKYELTFLLNSDVKLTDGYFERQWKYFLRWDTFGVMGRITDMDSDHIQEAARMPKFSGFKLKTEYFFYSEAENPRLPTYCLSAANTLFNTAKLKEIGGFFELFTPFNYADMELSIRALRLKWRCYYEHDAICRRPLPNESKGDHSEKADKQAIIRNQFFLNAIHFEGWHLMGWHLQTTLFDLIPKVLIGKGWIRRSYTDVLKNKATIGACKQKMEDLAVKNDVYSSFGNAINKIRNSVKYKNYVHFKP